jgi:hypothetical protein
MLGKFYEMGTSLVVLKKMDLRSPHEVPISELKFKLEALASALWLAHQLVLR